MNKLREIRQNKRISMTELAKQAQVNYSSLSRWEKDWCVPTRQIAEKLAEALGATINEVFPDEKLKSLGGQYG